MGDGRGWMRVVWVCGVCACAWAALKSEVSKKQAVVTPKNKTPAQTPIALPTIPCKAKKRTVTPGLHRSSLGKIVVFFSFLYSGPLPFVNHDTLSAPLPPLSSCGLVVRGSYPE